MWLTLPGCPGYFCASNKRTLHKPMKTRTATLLFTFLLATATIIRAQSSFVKIVLSGNSNDASQGYAAMVLAFDQSGNNLLTSNDQGDETAFGQLNSKMFPFTRSADGFLISNYDSRPEIAAYTSIPFGIVSKNAGTVKIIAATFSNDPNVPQVDFVWIEKTATGERFSILDTVLLNVDANMNYNAGYVLHIGPAVHHGVAHEQCTGMNNGSLHVQGPNYAGFTHELSFNGVPVYTSVVNAVDTLVSGLAPGSYVSVVRINGIPVDSSDIAILPANLLLADFVAGNTVVNTGDVVHFADYSVGGTSYAWDFGDGHTSATIGNETHPFSTSGNYVVTLQVTDANGCSSSANANILVDSLPATSSYSQFTGGPAPFSAAGGNGPSSANSTHFRNTVNNLGNYRIQVNVDEATVSTVTIVSMNGTVIANETQTASVAGYALPAEGIYIVYVGNASGTTTDSILVTR